MELTIKSIVKCLPTPNREDGIYKWKNLYLNDTITYDDEDLSSVVVPNFLTKYKTMYEVVDGEVPPTKPDPDPEPDPNNGPVIPPEIPGNGGNDVINNDEVITPDNPGEGQTDSTDDSGDTEQGDVVNPDQEEDQDING